MRRSVSSSKDDSPLFEHRTSFRVRYAETDAMGWVYYATYLTYFEIGRTELMRACWKSYRELEDLGHRLPVVEVRCKYRRGARYDDRIDVDTCFQMPSGYRLRFDYKVRLDPTGDLLAEGWTEHCFVSHAGKPVPIPVELRQLAGLG